MAFLPVIAIPMVMIFRRRVVMGLKNFCAIRHHSQQLMMKPNVLLLKLNQFRCDWTLRHFLVLILFHFRRYARLLLCMAFVGYSFIRPFIRYTMSYCYNSRTDFPRIIKFYRTILTNLIFSHTTYDVTGCFWSAVIGKRRQKRHESNFSGSV